MTGVGFDWMLLGDMMKRIRFLFAGLVLLFGLTALNARGQSTVQDIIFNVWTEYELDTNDVPSDPTLTDKYLHLLYVRSVNVVKAIAIDQFGTPDWVDWAGATLYRRVNLVTGEEGIYLSRGGTNEVNVSSYFGGTYISNFTTGANDAFPWATNNFDTNNPDPLKRLYSTTPTNHTASGGFYFISLNTTNLKFNLAGMNFGGGGNGDITKFTGDDRGTNYFGEIQSEAISVVGTFSWNASTNVFDVAPVTNAFYSGPAQGWVTIGVPIYTLLAAPP